MSQAWLSTVKVVDAPAPDSGVYAANGLAGRALRMNASWNAFGEASQDQEPVEGAQALVQCIAQVIDPARGLMGAHHSKRHHHYSAFARPAR